MNELLHDHLIIVLKFNFSNFQTLFYSNLWKSCSPSQVFSTMYPLVEW